MKRDYYSDPIAEFLDKDADTILGALAASNEFSLEASQRDAWLEEIRILKSALTPHRNLGAIYFEYAIPRLGRRIDVVLVIGPAILVLEFKVGEREFTSYAIDQVWDYALDLKNFHETSHAFPIAPVLIATNARSVGPCKPVGAGISGFLSRSAPGLGGHCMSRGRRPGDQHRRRGNQRVDRCTSSPFP